ncbi:MAG: hypothetical protein JO296_08615 [Pseudonocardiales bacterium]|nr:hypothetical protein [Pseudonocardiales bacterium]MBV9650186.1 hypothetical protein [Pseudonocardiales bacterium]
MPAQRWFVRSMGDHDTHLGSYNPTSRSVHALCGVEFVALAVGMPPKPGPLPGAPVDPAQICPKCRRVAR